MPVMRLFPIAPFLLPRSESPGAKEQSEAPLFGRPITSETPPEIPPRIMPNQAARLGDHNL